MTKGMWMIITGSVGLMLTIVWIITSIIRYRKQEHKIPDDSFSEEEYSKYLTQRSLPQNHLANSTISLEDMELSDQSTVLLDHSSETEFLE